MIEIQLDDLVEATIVQELKSQISMLEGDIENGLHSSVWFLDKEKDREAVKHLIHCMKVVADWYSVPSEGSYFDYSIAKEYNEQKRVSA